MEAVVVILHFVWVADRLEGKGEIKSFGSWDLQLFSLKKSTLTKLVYQFLMCWLMISMMEANNKCGNERGD